MMEEPLMTEMVGVSTKGCSRKDTRALAAFNLKPGCNYLMTRAGFDEVNKALPNKLWNVTLSPISKAVRRAYHQK